eukprot:TRINITY_DN59287_c0_g1_i1.p1 TRINITY_DN59287_c0_g1~~TRINITY_DN59287_c0_g1_i1.p1  ORF type:complete len:382 (-),score=70.20 TRINITY_DN59287_c0_g1_i1:152-1297(-)
MSRVPAEISGATRRAKPPTRPSVMGQIIGGPTSPPPAASPSTAPVNPPPKRTVRPSGSEDLPPDVARSLTIIKQCLLKRTGGGFAAMARLLRTFDDNGDCKMDEEEFIEALEVLRLCQSRPTGPAALGGLGAQASQRFLRAQAKTGGRGHNPPAGAAGTAPTRAPAVATDERPLTHEMASRVFDALDHDGSGKMDVGEFIMLIRPSMNDRRLVLVRKAFDILDTDRSGVASVSELAAKFDVSRHPQVVSGFKTREQALREFMGAWWDADGDGNITFREFRRYYDELSATIDSDEYFELMVRNAWRIPGGTGQAKSSAIPRAIVEHLDGSKEVVEVQQSLGLKRSDTTELVKRLQRQGVRSIKRAVLLGVTQEDPPAGFGKK